MNQKELLKNYEEELNELRVKARNLDLSNVEIDKIFQECFDELEGSPRKSHSKTVFKVAAGLLLLLFLCYVLLYVHQPTSSIVLRNVQGLIYPGLKLVRFLSMPIIKRVSSLTELYDESCLVSNPYFYVHDMECWPCENVHSVLNVSGFENFVYHESDAPLIIKTKQKEVRYEDLRLLYEQNMDIFDADAWRVKSTSYNITKARDFLNWQPDSSSDVHASWRINRMLPGRVLRKLFPRPEIKSEWSGQSMERFVMIDEPRARSYSLPDFECSDVVVIQGSGERSIVLKPTRECKLQCKPVSVVLKPSYLLRYNWWYWRPISLPVENCMNTSVSYITSYC